MPDYSRDQLMQALRNADKAGDVPAATAIAKRIKAMDTPQAPARPPMVNTALNSLAAVGGSLWRGASALPDMAADAGDAITGGIANALGIPQRKGNFRMSNVPDMLGTPRPVAPGVEFAGNVLGGAMTPGPKTPPSTQALQRTTQGTQQAIRAATAPTKTAAQKVVQAGLQYGVPVLTSDVKPPRTFVGKIAQATGERVIGMGTGGVRDAQNAKRIAAVEQFVTEHGGSDLIDNVNAVAQDLIANRSKQLNTLTTAKNSAIKNIPGNVPVDRTLTTIDEQVARLSGINKDAFAPVISKLEQFKANLASGKTLDQIEGNRKLLGDLFADPSLAAIKGDGQKALNAIYAPLRAEMGTFIRSRGGAPAFNKWKTANERLAALAGELDASAFKNVLGAADTTPEKVASLIFNKSPSEVQRLTANLSPAGRIKAQSAIVAKAAEGATTDGVISPQRFASAMEKMGRNVGVLFDAGERSRIDGFTRLIKATQRASETAAVPPTGVQSTMAAMYGSAGLAGWKGIAALQGYGVLARIYESAPVRNMLIGLGKTKPGSKAEAAILKRLAVPVAAIIERDGSQIMNAANDRTAASAAASNETGTNNQGQQQPLPQ